MVEELPMPDSHRELIAEVLEDARDGLLDSIEDGVDRIIEITGELVPVKRTVIGGRDDEA